MLLQGEIDEILKSTARKEPMLCSRPRYFGHLRAGQPVLGTGISELEPDKISAVMQHPLFLSAPLLWLCIEDCFGQEQVIIGTSR